jgi:hypothetical protein
MAPMSRFVICVQTIGNILAEGGVFEVEGSAGRHIWQDKGTFLGLICWQAGLMGIGNEVEAGEEQRVLDRTRREECRTAMNGPVRGVESPE